MDDCFPSAEVIAKLAAISFENGEIVSASQAVPVYLRDNVASKPKQRPVQPK
jgi:tRNA threonylcarbamoyladenosine biosynthesis protein TsaB